MLSVKLKLPYNNLTERIITTDYPNNTTNTRKQKYLNFEQRITIQHRLKDGYSPYRITQELGRASNTIRNEIKRGTVSQIIQGKTIKVYLADAGKANYDKHRRNCCSKFKRLACNDFINYVCDHMKKDNWSVLKHFITILILVF